MAACESRKQDSNITGLSFAEEECLLQLPANPVWYGRSPNSYADFGGENTMVARSPIDPSRQNKKGTVVDLDASGGWNEDAMATNLTRINQGFFFADAREPFSNAPLNGVQIPITAVDAATKAYALAGALALYKPGQLVMASGFGIGANNGLKTLATATATEATVVEVLLDEVTVPAGAKLTPVGVQLDTGEVDIVMAGNEVTLVSDTLDFATLGYIVGQWLFIGGDATVSRFNNNVGFARIKSISENVLVFDDVSWTPQAESGAAKTIHLYTGVVIKNENSAALIKRRSYNIERTLGMGANGQQAEYLEGAVANELTLNLPSAELVTVDMAFVACNNTFRSGDPGDTLKDGTRVAAPNEAAFNTTSNLYRVKMSVHDNTSSTPKALFGYVSEATVTINNGVTPNKALGVMGAFDTSAGNFEVGGTATVYFTDIAAVRAVRNNADVGYNLILSADNKGSIWDIPLLSLGGGRIAVEKDQPIMLPLETSGAENAAGYTMLYQEFAYLPSVAMPQ